MDHYVCARKQAKFFYSNQREVKLIRNFCPMNSIESLQDSGLAAIIMLRVSPKAGKLDTLSMELASYSMATSFSLLASGLGLLSTAPAGPFSVATVLL